VLPCKYIYVTDWQDGCQKIALLHTLVGMHFKSANEG